MPFQVFFYMLKKWQFSKQTRKYAIVNCILVWNDKLQNGRLNNSWTKGKNRLVEAFDLYEQVSLCQKLLFLHQPTHDITTNWKFQAQTWGEHVVYKKFFWHSDRPAFRTIFVHNKFSPMFCKKKSFLKKYTCTGPFLYILTSLSNWKLLRGKQTEVRT